MRAARTTLVAGTSLSASAGHVSSALSLKVVNGNLINTSVSSPLQPFDSDTNSSANTTPKKRGEFGPPSPKSREFDRPGARRRSSPLLNTHWRHWSHRIIGRWYRPYADGQGRHSFEAEDSNCHYGFCRSKFQLEWIRMSVR